MSTDAPQTEQKTTPHVERLHAHGEGYISDEEYKKVKESEEREAQEKLKVEQNRALRQAQWEKDPEMFIHADDVIFGAIKAPNGSIGILSGGHERPIVEAAITRMTYKAFMMFQHMDLQQQLRQRQTGLVDPDGNPIK